MGQITSQGTFSDVSDNQSSSKTTRTNEKTMNSNMENTEENISFT
jgi:hypothetical protein